MSARNTDSQGRWRNITVGFRVSPEENAQINVAVALSGLSKQEYCCRRCLEREIVVQGNPRVYKALRNELAAVLDELRRIESGGTVSKETTVPNPSVGADGEQPISKTSVSIPDAAGNCNPAALDTENYFREMERMTDPAYLPTITMQGLYEKVYDSRPAIIKGLLHTGTYLFVGAPKVGKSFFMAQLAYHVSTGISLWDYPVRKGTVLYLALEDDHRRLQSRLFRMFGTESTEDLHFATYSHKLGAGLEDQLQCFVREHPDMKLIIIDTLQKIRESDSERSCYASDYKVVSQLKQFADAKGICLLLVHHTRKQQADDKFDMISGTNGLLGAADGAFLLQKAKRTDSTATLDVSGRDQQDQRFHLIRDPERLLWQLDRTETEPQKEPPDPVWKQFPK